MTEHAETHHDASESLELSAPQADATGRWTAHVFEHDGLDRALVGRRVLVADDENAFRESVTDMLGPCGCRIDTACDGAEACALVANNRYDLVISDVAMPGATGYDVFAAAKAADHDTGVVLMTAFGYDPDHSVVKANLEGSTAVLVKPFEADDLLKRCRGALSSIEA